MPRSVQRLFDLVGRLQERLPIRPLRGEGGAGPAGSRLRLIPAPLPFRGGRATRRSGPDGPPIRLAHVVTAPVIYLLIIPFVLLDLFVSAYQAICFPAYGIARVKRSDYIRLDRYKLGYLNLTQKMNCLYCGYVNGLIAYVGEVAGRTEAYWCPIKHAARVAGRHRHYEGFMEYGDGDAFWPRLERRRRRLSGPTAGRSAAAKADDDIDL
ncbi:hypothetical protein OB2597_14721 [Pseudooceanicola batsensis HTCC2597]|uniref:Uncharacterized protein n=1 Tax=Pseudooceanicola batsensis (strain ATCC BAA-863 / DSM 15984 / KCTC 12145 / HTCC2597) TaxID=252305 RepID=A3U2A6_PSEBH|nr:hypothetical protein [Pseudooceanicola batsensis]EAQ01706.1 hypothetical protein OB2597_14721 [Pseudooceanicola batsensis HTCC2597]